MPGFGRILIHDWLGCGAFCQVYKVIRGSDTSTFYALKCSRSPGVLIREHSMLSYAQRHFPDEALRAVVKCHGIGNCDDLSFMVQELCDLTLLDLLGNGDYYGAPLGFCLSLLRGLIHVLKALWESHIVHSDIKPENIMLRGDKPEPFLIDFGSATPAGVALRGFHHQSRFYRAPEVILEVSATREIDVWSLGAVLAEVNLGYPIFAGYCRRQMLQLMELRLGRFPDKLLSRSTVKDNYFQDGKARGAELHDERFGGESLEALLLGSVFDGETDEARKAFTNLVTKMLAFDPEDRITPHEIFDHPFLHLEIQPPPAGWQTSHVAPVQAVM
jgi:serine/threonine protein kinase